MSYPEYPQYPYPQPQYPQPQPPNRGPQIVAVIAAIIAVAAVVAVVVLFVNSGGDDEVAAPESSGPVVTEYVQAPASPGSDTDTGVKQPPAPSPTQSSSAPQLPIPPIAGANAHGFVGGPTCDDNADPLVFLGYTQRSQVIVCQVGRQTGRYYYKGKADGQFSHVDFPTRSGNTFTATNGNTSYIVSPQSLVITENGRVLTTEPMREAWVN